MTGLSRSVRAALLVQYLHPILDSFFRVIAVGSGSVQTSAILHLTGTLSRIANETSECEVQTATSGKESVKRNNFLQSYLDFSFDNISGTQPHLYAFMSEALLHAIETTGREEENMTHIVRNSWFVFDVIVKSLTLKYHADGSLDGRHLRAPMYHKTFAHTIDSLIGRLADLCQTKTKEDVTGARLLINTIGYFVRDMFLLVDTTVIRGMIRAVLNRVTSHVFLSLFMRILLDYEHCVPYNRPRVEAIDDANLIKDSLAAKYSLAYAAIFPTEALLKEFKRIGSHGTPASRGFAGATLSTLLTRHDYDERYTDPAMKARLAVMYFPVVVLYADAADFFQADDTTISREEKRGMLISFLYVLFYVDRGFLRDWLKKASPTTLTSFFSVLRSCAHAFQYDFKSGSKDPKFSALVDYVLLDIVSECSTEFSDMLWRASVENKKLNEESLEYVVLSGLLSVISALFASNVSVNVFDSLCATLRFLLAQHKQLILKGASPGLAEVFANLLRFAASTSAALRIRATATGFFVMKMVWHCNHSWDLFGGDVNVCLADVVHRIARVNEPILNRTIGMLSAYANVESNSSTQTVEERFAFLCSAIASILIDIPRVQREADTLEQAMTVASVVRACKTVLEGGASADPTIETLEKKYTQTRREDSLRFPGLAEKLQKLCVIVDGSVGDTLARLTEKQTMFEKVNAEGPRVQLTDLIRKVLRVLTDSVFLGSDWEEHRLPALPAPDVACAPLAEFSNTLAKMVQDALVFRDIQDDGASPELAAEVYFRTAQRVINQPSQHLRWISRLGEFHRSKNRLAESAQCHLYTLVFSEQHAAELEIQEEDVLKLLRNAAESLEAATMYELSPPLLQRLVDAAVRTNDYATLQALHAQLTSTYSKILEPASQFRFLGNYYRIGFYGDVFGSDDGVEYVYKENGAILPEVAQRMREETEKKYSKPVVVFPDSRPIVRANLDPGKVFLQITSVDIYFDEKEKANRQTWFQKRDSVSRFVFETPFTLAGGVHAEKVTEQYKRRTIVTTEHPFPFLVTRQRVVNRQEIQLDPITNSLDTVTGRTRDLLACISANPPDVKKLQSLLQGSVLVQVNAGVGSIAESFLRDPSPYDPTAVRALQDAFVEFLDVCKRAMRLNKNLVDVSLEAFHNEMEKGLRSLTALLTPLISR
eukprot:TRINITY_DN2022_c0_g1_i3.p1 TRINITY_DN2022_c0_g1~~TRINITY_DN2022_c0_g1_i3.p1  ORF type:complete len:1167 (+),score=297.09 TRINITY_DN2022_c0_g1_i3:2038-5538(+)